MKIRLLILNLILCTAVFGQNFWSTTQLDQRELKQNKTTHSGERLYAIDLSSISDHLRNAPSRTNLQIQSNVTIEIPNLNGKFEKFYVAEASNFASDLQAQYPNIRSYRGINVNNPSVTISLSISPRGVQAMRLEAGQPTTFLEAISTDNAVYSVFEKSARNSDWSCETPEDELQEELLEVGGTFDRDADDQILRDFRLALSCTGEYAQYFGGTVAGALAGMNATMTRVNPILERDLALHLTMIDNNAEVVYIDPATDPYSPATNDGMNEWNQELQSNLNDVIGSANYDIGHLFGGSGGGGNAGCIGCVCNIGKGSGFTSPANGVPEGDNFDVDYVIHEMGHQLGANHTFSSYEGSGVNYEPGSGSTIMAYAGIRSPSTQDHSDDYFHSGSIMQITSNVKNKTCPTEIPITNETPVADAGADYYIPASTPYILTGSATDPDGDNLTYCWEQVDSSSPGTGFEAANPDATSGPLVRSMLPTTVPTRYIPSFEMVLNGNLYSTFESVSRVSRDINFALQIRDNNPEIGQTDSDRMIVNVVNSGEAFKVTSPSTETTVLSDQNNEVTWNVAESNVAPINTEFVDIYLSLDNGETFDLIADNTENDGSEMVYIPAGSTTQEARIMIMAVDNIFYTVSNNFYIDFSVQQECFSYAAQGLPRDIADGSGGSSPSYGSYAVGTFQVADHGAVDELTIEVDVEHTYISDLQMVLQSPSPIERINLWDLQCGSNNDLVVTFDDNANAPDCSNLANSEVTPSTPLSTFAGFQTQGNWVIGVRDGFTADTGTFNSATATFCQNTATPVATNEVASTIASHIKVYPNPSKGIFNFELDVDGNGLSYSVYDVTGKLLMTAKDSNASGKYNNQVDLSSFAKGTYILQVRTGTKIINKKLLVK